jgi:hypothetical protein
MTSGAQSEAAMRARSDVLDLLLNDETQKRRRAVTSGQKPRQIMIRVAGSGTAGFEPLTERRAAGKLVMAVAFALVRPKLARQVSQSACVHVVPSPLRQTT